ncbi:MAG: autotransporter-associated beta strand repeat-containing protein [Terrimicrobiaceae bacterium]
MKTTNTTITRIAASLALFVSVASLPAQTWVQTTGGPYNWGDNANWSPENFPNSNAATANLTADITQDIAITLNQDITVKNLIIGDPSPLPNNNYAITQGGAFTLNLSANTGIPTIAQNSGNNTIAVPVSFTGPSGAINNNAAGTTLLFTDSVSSSGSIIKGGTGDVVFAGNLTVASGLPAGSIGLQVSSGLLQLANIGSTADMTNHRVFVATGASNATLQVYGDLTDASGIDLGAGTGTATLDVNAGATVAVGGPLRLGFNTGSTAVANINDGLVTATSVALASGPESSGTLNISTDGTVTADSITWSNNATASATINLNGGVLNAASISGAGTGTDTLSFDGGTLNLAAPSGNQTLGTNIETVGIKDGGATIMVTSAATTLSIDPALTANGTGGLTKSGDGTLVLNGNNTYSGGTTLNAGIVQIGSDSKLGDTSGNLTFNGGSLAVTSGLTLARAITVAAGGGTLAQGANAVQVDGAFSGSGGFTKTGAGALIFNGAGTNTANGTLTVEAGAVNAAAANVLGSGQKVFLHQGTSLDLAGHNQTVGGLVGNGSVTLGSASLTLNLSDDRAFSGVLSGNGSLIKTGVGSQQISNESSTYSGGTQVLGGTLVVPSDAALGSAAGGITLDAGTLMLTSSTTSFSTARSIALGASGGTFDTAGRTATLNGGISGNGSLTKSGTGILVLAGANSYAGGTAVNAGTVSINSDARLGSGSATLNGGLLSVTSTTSSARDFVLVGGSLKQAEFVTHTISGNLSGAGALKKEGPGTLALSGNNTYQGGTQINGGLLSVASDAHLGNAAGAVAIGAATLQATGTFSTARGLSLASTTSSISVSSGQVLSWDGTVDGTGSLTKTGSGELSLTGTNTYAGTTTISSGTLTISSQENLGSGSSAIAFGSAGTLKTAAALTFTRSLSGDTGTVDTGGFDSVFSAPIVFYSLTKAGNGTLTLSNAGNSSHSLTVQGGTLRAGTAGAVNTSPFGSVSVSGGATYDLDGYATSIGGLTGSGSVTLGNATLTIDNYWDSHSFGGGISGAGSLVKTGGGSQTLSGSNSYAGGTIVQSGSLVFSQAASVPTSGQITVAAGGYAGAGFAMDQAFLDKFDKASSVGVIGFNASSSNVLDLTGFNTSATLGSSSSANFSGSLTPQGSAFRFGGGYGQLTVSGNLGGSKSLSNAGALTLFLSGTNSYDGGTSAASMGRIIFANAAAIPAAGSLTAASGGYIGNSFAVDQTFLDKFDKANSAGTIGVNTDTSSSLDLTGFHAEASLGTTGSVTVDGTLTPQGSQYRFAGGGGSMTVGSTLSGSRSVFISDLGVTLTSGNSYSGGTQIDWSGLLVVGSNSHLGDSSGGITLAGTLATTASFSMTRTISTAGGTLDVASGTTLTANGAVSGTSLYKTGSGTLVLGNSNTFTGTLGIYGGQVSLGAAGALPSGVSLSLGSGTGLDINGFSQSVSGISTSSGSTVALGSATLTVDSESYNEIYGDVSGTGSLVKNGNGYLTMSAGKTYQGGTTLNAGTLYVEGSTSLGTGGLAFNSGTLATDYSFTSNHSITFSGAGAKTILVADYDPSDAFATVLNLGGPLSGSGNFTKSGAGILELSGTSSHSGSLTVSDGGLKVSGTTSSAVIASSSGTVVSGTGSVGSLLISNGAILAPGNSPGTLSAASATFASDGNYNWQIQSNSVYDMLNVTGTLSITATSADPFVIHVFTLDGNGDPGLMSGFNTAANASWTLVNANSITGFAANKFSVDLGGFSNFYDGTFAVATNGSNDLVLNYTAPTAPVPEPSTYALLILAGAALFLTSRRKKQPDFTRTARRSVPAR